MNLTVSKIYSAMDQPLPGLVAERRIIALLADHNEQGISRTEIARQLGETEDDLLATLLQIERSGIVGLTEDRYRLIDYDPV